MRNTTLSIASLVASIFVAGCSANSTTTCQGAVRCYCYPNATCNTGLLCLSNVCVAPPDGAINNPPPPPYTPVDAAAPVTDIGSAPDVVSAPGDDASPSDGLTPGGDGASAAGSNVITNGDFSQGTTLWALVVGNGTLNVSSNELCISLGAMKQTILGWPQPPSSPGVPINTPGSYTFSYAVRVTSAPVTVHAKVGHTTDPYTAAVESMDGATTLVQTFTHPFMPMQPDTSAGLSFEVTSPTAQQICFRSVSLVQQN